jgi:hypothetical protein
MSKRCSIEGCKNIYRARGFCSTHYYREYTIGIGANTRTTHSHRPAIIDGKVAKIPLGIDMKEYSLVDKQFAHLDKFKWRKDHYGYATAYVNGKQVKLHQLIIGKKEGYDIDHISRDKLDNRKSNLRHATRKVNVRNTGMYKHNTSGHKGISWETGRKKWSAKIQTDGVTYNLGRFNDIKDAIKARKEAQLKHWEGQ